MKMFFLTCACLVRGFTKVYSCGGLLAHLVRLKVKARETDSNVRAVKDYFKSTLRILFLLPLSETTVQR